MIIIDRTRFVKAFVKPEDVTESHYNLLTTLNYIFQNVLLISFPSFFFLLFFREIQRTKDTF